MSIVTIEQLAAPDKTPRWNRWDSPWLNPKLIGGFLLVMFVVLLGVVGPLFWDITLARVASSPLNLPPVWVKDAPVRRARSAVLAHPRLYARADRVLKTYARLRRTTGDAA